jgi:hypothetical protein
MKGRKWRRSKEEYTTKKKREDDKKTELPCFISSPYLKIQKAKFRKNRAFSFMSIN